MTSASLLPDVRDGGEVVESFAELGVLAFTTGRAAGSFGTASQEPVAEVMARWSALRTLVSGRNHRLGTAVQVHGSTIVRHEGGWTGWLRGESADGHISVDGRTAMAVTVADCVPVFIAHPSGAIAALHSGWRGTAARITDKAIALFTESGHAAADLRVHCGPAICGACYEVSADVYAQLTGTNPGKKTTIDLRAVIAGHAAAVGVREITVSPLCTKCDNDRFFSHRAGDPGRQLGVIARVS
ncbi:MAG: Multi-copper polyphenol oxidoreductase, laccase [Gemmatimonadetes bacterium]|nr:Multi-copper polyphenol oxidoreductase, laccase [Gemmatimonadota bacterium]